MSEWISNGENGGPIRNKLNLLKGTVDILTGTTNVKLIISDYTVLSTDHILLINGSANSIINLNIPTIMSSNIYGYIIKNVGYGTINILPIEYIDNYSSITISYHNTSISIKPIIDQWVIV